jgi:tetrathionate reductase subunit B
MDTKRRNVVKAVAATAAAAAMLPISSMAGHPTHPGPRYGMVIDLRKCTGCHSCTIACKSEFEVPKGKWRAWVKDMEQGKYPNVSRQFLPRLCNHCEDAPCVSVCPTKAAHKRDDGIVLIDYDICVGCGYCIVACPYDARFRNPIDGVANKCTFCAHRVDKGLKPVCVDNCTGRARVFGDLTDPDSEAFKLISQNPTIVLKPELGTDPHVFYIYPEGTIMGRIEEESYEGGF